MRPRKRFFRHVRRPTHTLSSFFPPLATHTVLAVPRSIIPHLTSGTLTRRGFSSSARQTSPQGTGAVHWQSPAARAFPAFVSLAALQFRQNSPQNCHRQQQQRRCRVSSKHRRADMMLRTGIQYCFEKLSQSDARVACSSLPIFLLCVSRGVMTLVQMHNKTMKQDLPHPFARFARAAAKAFLHHLFDKNARV